MKCLRLAVARSKPDSLTLGISEPVHFLLEDFKERGGIAAACHEDANNRHPGLRSGEARPQCGEDGSRHEFAAGRFIAANQDRYRFERS